MFITINMIVQQTGILKLVKKKIAQGGSSTAGVRYYGGFGSGRYLGPQYYQHNREVSLKATP